MIIYRTTYKLLSITRGNYFYIYSYICFQSIFSLWIRATDTFHSLRIRPYSCYVLPTARHASLFPNERQKFESNSPHHVTLKDPIGSFFWCSQVIPKTCKNRSPTKVFAEPRSWCRRSPRGFCSSKTSRWSPMIRNDLLKDEPKRDVVFSQNLGRTRNDHHDCIFTASLRFFSPPDWILSTSNLTEGAPSAYRLKR